MPITCYLKSGQLLDLVNLKFDVQSLNTIFIRCQFLLLVRGSELAFGTSQLFQILKAMRNRFRYKYLRFLAVFMNEWSRHSVSAASASSIVPSLIS